MERLDRQQQYMNQFAREASYDSSEPTSITNSSTVEGEHTIQNPDRRAAEEDDDDDLEHRFDEEEEEEDRTLATTPVEEEDDAGLRAAAAQSGDLVDDEDVAKMGEKSALLNEFNAEDIGLLRQKLEEVR